ncbi:cell division protein FtsQ/DivIB [Bombilactobacillus thymidiniphilus]|uniref:Cell division protein DivIB n=1 Tax=Bombilactobacillus thymidiniphilus TaxID=2923363 RepID=A0ABY4PE49_9LACO|nr:cell division protein FtsQ/DivIB [Bombilactobacillus thymidiniphilus]UQS83791.1 FtsQ-type POTRA domain-containing protein [Bombilactobacillus thymidiniphilus]
MLRQKKDKLISFDNDYQPKEQQPKKVHWWNKISPISYLVVLLVTLVIFISYLVSPIGHVQQIMVSGTNYLGAQQVIDASKISHNSLVLQTIIQKPTIKKQIKNRVPLIKDVDYHYDGYNKLKIKVREYQTVGFVVQNNGYYRVLENKKIIQPKLRQPIGNFPVYQTFGAKTSLSEIVKFYLAVPHALKSDISEVHGSKDIKNHPYRLTIYMNDGNMVIGDIRTLAAKLKYYPAITKQMSDKGIVNLEIGAYSKPYPSKKE